VLYFAIEMNRKWLWANFTTLIPKMRNPHGTRNRRGENREFTRRAMAGGVQGYSAFLRGKRVTDWSPARICWKTE
jgi:hypothetical protein